MRNFNFYIFCLCAMLTSFLFGCTKEDGEAPEIYISQPLPNKSFNTIDTISIIADITDNEQLKYVEVSLLNSDFIAAGKSQNYTASGTQMQLNVGFELDLPLLLSGNYYIAVRASDGKNIGSAYLPVYLHATSKILERVYVALSNGAQTELWGRESTDTQFQQKLSLLSGYGGSGLSFRTNVLLLAGSTVSDAVFYTSEDLQPFNSIPNLSSGTYPYFRGAEFTSYGNFYLLLDNGQVQVFDADGVSINGFFAVNNYRALEIFEDDYSLFTVEEGISAPVKLLVARHKNGSFHWQYPIEGEVKGIFGKNINEVFVWLQQESGYTLKIFNRNNGAAETVSSVAGAELYDVLPEGNGNFLLCTNSGILRYSYGQQTTIVAPDVIAEKIYLNEIDGSLYCVSGSNINVLSQDGNNIGQWSFSMPIQKVLFDYNR